MTVMSRVDLKKRSRLSAEVEINALKYRQRRLGHGTSANSSYPESLIRMKSRSEISEHVWRTVSYFNVLEISKKSSLSTQWKKLPQNVTKK